MRSSDLDLLIGEAEYTYRGLGQYVILVFLSERVFFSLVTPPIILLAVPPTTAGAFGALESP